MTPPDQIARVPVELLPRVWPQIIGRVERALRTFDLYDATDALQYVTNGRWELWVTTRDKDVTAFGMCEVCEFPKRRVLVIHVSGGPSLEDHNAMWPVIKASAQARKCTRVISDPRRGWFRAGKLPVDWKHVADTAMAEV